MMRFNKNITNGCKIIIEGNTEEGKNVAYHTIDDWGLAIVNTDYIKDPEQETAYINIPFANGFVDASEAVAGRPIYKKREITIKLKGFREIENWDNELSDIRNKIHGKICRITFDNDPDHFWKGRVSVKDFTRQKEVGYFIISIPYADPYKYDVVAFNEDWLWDSFNFETGHITNASEHTITGHTEIIIPSGLMPVSPTIIVTNINTFLTVQKYGDSRVIDLRLGENKVYAITVNDQTESILMFEGDGTFSINYRGGSL